LGNLQALKIQNEHKNLKVEDIKHFHETYEGHSAEENLHGFDNVQQGTLHLKNALSKMRTAFHKSVLDAQKNRPRFGAHDERK
jgi:hypothetical protein